jgi:hypothetical protein
MWKTIFLDFFVTGKTEEKRIMAGKNLPKGKFLAGRTKAKQYVSKISKKGGPVKEKMRWTCCDGSAWV